MVIETLEEEGRQRGEAWMKYHGIQSTSFIEVPEIRPMT